MPTPLAFVPFENSENIRQNRLQELYRSQENQRAEQQAQRAQKADQRAETQFGQQQNLQAIDQLGAVLDKVQDGDAAGFEQAKQFAIQNRLIDPQAASQFTVNDLPRIRAMSQQARQMVAQRQAAERQGRMDESTLATQGAQRGLIGAQTDLARANAEKALRPPSENPKQVFDNEYKIRKDYEAKSGDFVKVRDAYRRVETSAKQGTPAGDLSMIFNFMKILDPGSVVRESEFAVAAQAKPLVERYGLNWDSVAAVWQGNKLTPNQRADFMRSASQLYSGQAEIQGERLKQSREIAGQYGLDPERTVPDLTHGVTPPGRSSAEDPLGIR